MPLVRDLLITVDQKNETVLLPIYGVMVPFHITTIKNVVSNAVRVACACRRGGPGAGRRSHRRLPLSFPVPHARQPATELAVNVRGWRTKRGAGRAGRGVRGRSW
eukprot:342912-Chlamydomonas_euryale.AAC.1